ncbi:MAG: hypothetical protein KC619_02155 [Myxococcales bacterium]|nr:hypothetical protein [Myxococcales bacterium]
MPKAHNGVVGLAAGAGCAVLAVVAVAIAAMVWVADALTGGPTRLHVVAPDDATATLLIDGHEAGTAERAGHLRVDLDQGRHDLTVRSGSRDREYSIEVPDSRGCYVVPATAEQCWVQVNVNGWYGQPALPATVAARYSAEEPARLFPGSFYFGRDELPDSVDNLERPFVMEPVRCDRLGLDDATLLEQLGY